MIAGKLTNLKKGLEQRMALRGKISGYLGMWSRQRVTAMELTQPRKGGGGLCRVTGPLLGLCRGTVRNGSCTGMSGTCVIRVTCAGCATMTRKGGGGHWVCRGNKKIALTHA